MTPERWLSLKRVYQEAVERDPDHRPAYLDEACAGDPALRAEVDGLLSASAAAAGFLETPAAEVLDPAGTGGETPTSPSPATRIVRLRKLGMGMAAAVLLLAAAGSLWWSRATIASVPPASIAVLPFADLSPGHDQESLSDGLTEKILDLLAEVPGLRAAARTSTFAFKGKSGDVRAIARKLNVNAILEGSVRTMDDRVRVTAQLLNGADGFDLWSETYERKLTDLQDLEDEIGRAIVARIELKLVAGPARAPARPRTDTH